jgi:hypothetical protein
LVRIFSVHESGAVEPQHRGDARHTPSELPLCDEAGKTLPESPQKEGDVVETLMVGNHDDRAWRKGGKPLNGDPCADNPEVEEEQAVSETHPPPVKSAADTASYSDDRVPHEEGGAGDNDKNGGQGPA